MVEVTGFEFVTHLTSYIIIIMCPIHTHEVAWGFSVSTRQQEMIS